MITIQKIMPQNEICHIIKCIDKDEVRTLTHLRKLLETKELAGAALLRTTIKLFCKGCICEGTVYILAGLALQHGASIELCDLCCFDSLACQSSCVDNNVNSSTDCKNRLTEKNCNHAKVKTHLIMMGNVMSCYGICPLSKEQRNWLGSLLNRNDMFEGGIVPVPEVFMKECGGSLQRAVSTGSHRFYEGMVHYARLVDCNILNKILRQIVDLGVKFMDLTPILYAIKEGGDSIKMYANKVIGHTEPENETMREGLIRISNALL